MENIFDLEEKPLPLPILYQASQRILFYYDNIYPRQKMNLKNV